MIKIRNNNDLYNILDDDPTDELPLPGLPGKPVEPRRDGIREPRGDDRRTAAEYRAAVQMLESYIDRRKAYWERQNTELRVQRETIAGLELSLAEKEASLGFKDREKQALRQTIEELRQRLESLTSLNAEFQSGNQKLLAALDEQRDATRREQQRVVDGEQQLADQAVRIRTLEAELESSRDFIRQFEQFIRAANDRGNKLQRKLDQSRQKLADHAELLEQHEDALSRIHELETLLGEQQNIRLDLEEQLQVLGDNIQAITTELTSRSEEKRQLESKLETLRAEHRQLRETVVQRARLPQRDTVRPAVPGEPPRDTAITCLMVATSGRKVVKYPLFKQVITIGRTQDCDIQIPAQYVSREHARIMTDPQGTVIEDLDSRNGVLVNSKKVVRRRLRHGDHVDIGEVHFKFIDLMDHEAGEGNA